MAKKKSGKKNGLNFRGLIWISRGNATFLGHGRVALLERIKEFGSISEAAKSMDMSYKHAWDLVDSMNRQARKPLVIKSTGGRGGGGATLTEEGERSICAFWDFHNDFQKFLKAAAKKAALRT